MQTVNFKTMIVNTMVLGIVIGIGSCGIRKLNAGKSQSSLLVKDEISLLSNEYESYQGKRIIMIRDSNNQQYRLKISPVDTFTFSLENGFKGKASSIEFKGTFQQKTATTDSSTFNGRKEIATHAGMIRKVQGEQLVSSKAVAKIWFNWWLVVALFVGSIFFLWTLHKLKGFAKRYTL